MYVSVNQEGWKQASNLFLSLESIAVRLMSSTDRGVSSLSACMHAGGQTKKAVENSHASHS
jgi:hypothetical protein